MGIEITKHLRCHIKVTLTCDGCRGFFVRSETLMDYDGFIPIYAEFMRRGWKDCHQGGKRVFLGPCCSGKQERGEKNGTG